MKVDLALVGGGLANALIAFRLAEAAPDLSIVLLERGSSVGGNHVWSFHGSDLTAEQQSWIEPLVERSWGTHEVIFPRLRRQLSGTYHSVTSERLDRELRARLGESVLLETSVSELAPDHVVTTDGQVVRARTVVDGRGLVPSGAMVLAYQKFVGLQLELARPVEIETPILMDATVEQVDGYRFIYTLPFGERRVLIEDTRYSDGSELDREDMRGRIEDYASSRGWRVSGVVGEEFGVLPIVLSGDIEAYWSERPEGIPCSGMRAALFHPTTGYSLPEAVRLADEMVRMRRFPSSDLDREIRSRSKELWRRSNFFRLLNRMLFHAAEPEERYRVLERFYRLPEPLIERFYRGQPTLGDRARTLMGKPPVPISRALGCMHPGADRRVNPNTESERKRGT